jgi:hypothetical protein
VLFNGAGNRVQSPRRRCSTRAVELFNLKRNIQNDFIRNTIQHNLEKWRHREQGKMSEAFEAVAHRFFGRIEDVVDRMMSTSADIFDIAFEKIASREFILGDRRFYFHFEEHPTFIPSLDSLGVTSLIPRALLQGHIVKNARDK